MQVKYDASYGIIPLRQVKGRWYALLIQHKHGKHWGFPKGHKEAGESGKYAAIRELKEETHLEVVHFFSEEPLVEAYEFKKGKTLIKKTVSYFAALVVGELLLQTEEVSDAAWFPLEEVESRLTYESSSFSALLHRHYF